VRLLISTEASLFGDVQILGAFDIDLTRAPGNPLNIPPPKRALPTVVPKGVVVLERNDTLGPADQFDIEFGKRGCRMKSYTVKLQAGGKYAILLTSNSFDSYLRLYGPDRQFIAKDDDSGGGLNARIDFQTTKAGVYQIVVTAFDAKLGPFQLKVIRLDAKTASSTLPEKRFGAYPQHSRPCTFLFPSTVPASTTTASEAMSYGYSPRTRLRLRSLWCKGVPLHQSLALHQIAWA
jgi:hypothetical protein